MNKQVNTELKKYVKDIDMNKLTELIKFVKTVSSDMKKQFDIYDKQESLDTNEEIEHYHSLEDSLSLLNDIKSSLKDINRELYDETELGDTSVYIQSELTSENENENERDL